MVVRMVGGWWLVVGGCLMTIVDLEAGACVMCVRGLGGLCTGCLWV